MPFILLGIVGLVWGISYPITAVALDGFDILTLRCLIQILGACAMLAQAAAFRRPLTVERAAWPDLIVAALLNMTMLPISFTVGVYLLGPGRTALLVYTMPIWATLFARVLLREKVTVSRVVALAFAAGAVAALMSQSLPELRDAPLGAAVTLLAAMSYGLGTVWLKRRVWRANAAVVTFWQLVVGTVPIVLIWAIVSFPPDLTQAGAGDWLAVLFLGVVGNGIAYFLWFRVIGLLPAGVAGIGALITPCVGVTSSVWLAGERLHPHDLAAIAMIGIALVLVLAEQRRLRSRRSAPAHDGAQSGL